MDEDIYSDGDVDIYSDGDVDVEVEDIMCDQTIISTSDFNAGTLESKTSFLILPFMPLRVTAAMFTRVIVPALLKLYYAYLRNQQTIVNSVRNQIFPTVIAFIANTLSKSLASVHRRRPIGSLKPSQERLAITLVENNDDATPERSVDCRVLHNPTDEILADVVFIHGLHGGIDRTWKQGQWRRQGHKLKRWQSPTRSQSAGELIVPSRRHSLKRTISEVDAGEGAATEEDDDEWEVVEESSSGYYSDCWPQDWLPRDCPGVRVIALNYTTDTLWCPVWIKKRRRTDMVQRSDEMIEELVRLGVGRKPIIWVGHSKGGLFIKQIIVNASERHSNRIEVVNITSQSKAIMFYSVPHRGSSLADFTLPLLRRSVELIEIKRNCNFVLNLHKRFLKLCNEENFNAEILSFIETSFTLMSFIYLKIVAYESADPGIGIKYDVPLDHREICKPAGRDCFLYLELVKIIKKYINNDDT